MKQLFIGVCLACLAAIPLNGEAQPSEPGVPPGVKPLQGHNSSGFPTPRTVPGRPIETRPPELSGDRPAFAGQTRAPYRRTAPYKVSVLTAKLQSPWSLAFLPDGKMLVTEKPGTMRIVSGAGVLSAPLKGVPAVNYQGQIGLLDVALDPRFGADKRIFFSFSEGSAAASHIAIASAQLDEPNLALSGVKVIFRAKPDLPDAEANNGGRIVLAPDGTLFATIGDRSKSPPWDVAQQLDTDLGKIIHITADGAPARGNPFIGKPGALPEIWTLGHRSEIGLAFDPSGRLWEDENGPRGGDELNLIEPGKNYGWPLVTHGIDYPGEKIDGGLTEKAGTEQPRYYWDPVIAPSGLAFYNASLFPQWKGSVLIGALRGQMLDRLTLRGTKVVDEEALLVGLHARIRDVRVGPDGAVYVLTDDSRLLKLTPKKIMSRPGAVSNPAARSGHSAVNAV
jgi:glucose/arabinose dehydrogenase